MPFIFNLIYSIHLIFYSDSSQLFCFPSFSFVIFSFQLKFSSVFGKDRLLPSSASPQLVLLFLRLTPTSRTCSIVTIWIVSTVTVSSYLADMSLVCLIANFCLSRIAFVTSSNSISTLFPVLDEVSAQRAPICIARVFAVSSLIWGTKRINVK